ncbi:MAG: hypothetical protein QOI47_1763 [Actinomycetota bacterium]|nr:hypothetical protein [Actinomycetota bacterium]
MLTTRGALGCLALVTASMTACGHTKVAPLHASSPVASFRIVYRIEQPQAPARWSEIVAKRPFFVRAASYDHSPKAGEQPTTGTLTTVDGLFQIRPEGLQEISGRQPSPGTGDQWLVPQLADAVARNLARPVATATILGRACTVYRFKEPPVGPIAELAGSDHDDLCLSADGLLLREVWTFKGRVVLRRTAERVTLAPLQVDAVFDTNSAAAPPDQGPIAAAAPSGSSYLPDPHAPPGFSLVKRDAFALLQPGDVGPVALYSSTVWAFTRGVDLITVEAGDSGASAKVPWSTSDPSRPERLPVGASQTVVRNDGAEVRVDLGHHHWLRVRGTVSLATLLRYARTLRAT